MTRAERLVLYVSILASFVAFLDGSVVNVALPAIAREFGGGLLLQQWVVDAYLITLGSLMLIAGSLADLFGRKKILLAGLWGFAAASVLCAFAPSGGALILLRAAQGVAGSLLVPSSLALIISQFSGEARGKAIGTWTAWTGIAFIIGPLVGGFLVDALSWRLIFAINVLPIAVTLWLLRSIAPVEPAASGWRLDYLGAFLCTLGLGGTVYGLIEQPRYGLGSPHAYLPLALGIGALVAFYSVERRAKHPMLSLELFTARNFLFGNLATFAVYAALGAALFLLSIFVQEIGDYSALGAGFALLPVTVIMFALSPYFGAWSGRIGPRPFMTLGPITAAAGFLLMAMVGGSVRYWPGLFPGIGIFGLGLSATVAPLTSAVLGAAGARHAGMASAINNAVARIAGLVAIAAIGLFSGSALTLAGFRNGMLCMAALLVLGGLISFFGIRNPGRAVCPAGN